MTFVLLAGVFGLAISLLGTPIAVRIFRRRGWGQLIREEGPKAHYEKRGTPTMGGLVILAGTILGYIAGHIGSDGV
ncbi:MAG TPA: phospho-N-acetylmuramoyl-pentapeptide-transferase, partial [Actinomycetota bacterium]|nr:phospho-N-acetylmuramoyl-pentapeptide-transferase [Actinomycetota bacterium]